MQMLFFPCVIKQELVPGMALSWYNCWLASLETSAKLQAHHDALAF